MRRGAKMSEQWYLCRVPKHGLVVMFRERDYNYQRMHEAQLRVPDHKNNVVLLAQGTKEEVKAYYELINGKDITNV